MHRIYFHSSLVMMLIGIFLFSLLLASCTPFGSSLQTQGSIPTPLPPTVTASPTPTANCSNTPSPTATETETRIPTATPRWADVPWAAELKAAAESFIRENPEDTLKLVQSFDYVDEAPGVAPQESAENSCGPLGVSILFKAGIFYPLQTPVVLHEWWEPNPLEGKPWGMLDMNHYRLYQFLFTSDYGRIGNWITPNMIPGDYRFAIQRFDFNAFPLCPGDWLYTRSVGSGFDHLVVVSEVDAQQRVWAVGNVPEATSDRFIIKRILLWDPSDATAGELKANFVNHHEGTSGKAGFWLLRPNGGCVTPPGYEQFLVNP